MRFAIRAFWGFPSLSSRRAKCFSNAWIQYLDHIRVENYAADLCFSWAGDHRHQDTMTLRHFTRSLITWVGFTSVRWKIKELFQPYSNFLPIHLLKFRSDFSFWCFCSAKFAVRERRIVSLTSRRTRRWWWAAAESARTPHSQQSASRTEAASCPCSETAGKRKLGLVLFCFFSHAKYVCLFLFLFNAHSIFSWEDRCWKRSQSPRCIETK